MHRRVGPGGAGSTLSLVLCLIVLAGCGAPKDDLETVPGWEEPGWMAQVRQQDESYVVAMISCYAEYGLKGTRGIGAASVAFVNLPEDPATQVLVEAASADCNARVPLPDHESTKTFDDASYERMLDLRTCILAHGYEVPEPPSVETWKDSDLESAWNPYTEVFDGPAGASISQDELRSLNEACPQPGPNYYVVYSAAPPGGTGG
jgi:hypothetical protein